MRTLELLVFVGWRFHPRSWSNARPGVGRRFV